MDQDVEPKAGALAESTSQPDRPGLTNGAQRHIDAPPDTDTDTASPDGASPDTASPDGAADPNGSAGHAHDERITRVVHIALGLVIAVVGGWLLYRSHTELAFRGPNGEPGPGYLPVLLTICLVGMGLLLAAVWTFGAKARHGDAPTLSLDPRGMGRALVVWLALLVCALTIEPLGFLLAGELLVVMIMVIERIRSIPLIITLLLVPPAMYLLFDTMLEVQLPGGTLWY